MQMDHIWEDTIWYGLVLVFFGQVISERQTATSKLTLQMGSSMERNVFQEIKPNI